MTEPHVSPVHRWRYGMHPHATEMQIRSLGRVDLQLGEALRIEMTNAARADEDIVHLQYYIATELGPWALWLSSSRSDAEEAEGALRELAPPLAAESRR